jgi:hypothetical protein
MGQLAITYKVELVCCSLIPLYSSAPRAAIGFNLFHALLQIRSGIDAD